MEACFLRAVTKGCGYDGCGCPSELRHEASRRLKDQSPHSRGVTAAMNGGQTWRRKVCFKIAETRRGRLAAHVKGAVLCRLRKGVNPSCSPGPKNPQSSELRGRRYRAGGLSVDNILAHHSFLSPYGILPIREFQTNGDGS